VVRQRVIESGVLLVLAVVTLGDGVRVLSLETATQIKSVQAGGYEMLLGGILAILAIAYLLRWGRQPGLDWRAEVGLNRVFIAFVILSAYAIAMPFLGYMLSTAIFLFALLRIFSTYRPILSLVVSCLVAVSSAWLCAELAIFLPTGFIPWP
jgi:hypothetical protein